MRITVYQMTLKCRSTALPNWFETGLLAVCEDQLAPYTQNIQEGIQNFQEIFLKVVLMYNLYAVVKK